MSIEAKLEDSLRAMTRTAAREQSRADAAEAELAERRKFYEDEYARHREQIEAAKAECDRVQGVAAESKAALEAECERLRAGIERVVDECVRTPDGIPPYHALFAQGVLVPLLDGVQPGHATTEPPTEPGWYWWRDDPMTDESARGRWQVVAFNNHFVTWMSGRRENPKHVRGEWWSVPIAMPPEDSP